MESLISDDVDSLGKLPRIITRSEEEENLIKMFLMPEEHFIKDRIQIPKRPFIVKSGIITISSILLILISSQYFIRLFSKFISNSYAIEGIRSLLIIGIITILVILIIPMTQ